MKIIFSFSLALFLLAPDAGGDAQNLFAQGGGETTVILLRHAEKDASPEADRYDPELSAQGRERALRLVGAVKKYRPEYIFTSLYKRTRATVTPLSESLVPGYRWQLLFYDYTKLKELADKINALRGRTIVVAGHNTTTPALANLLIKQEKYKPLQESEYNKIWIIKIKNGKVSDRVIEY